MAHNTTLVTGAAGFAGSHLLDALTGSGCDLVAWHRKGGSAPRDVVGVRWQAVDLTDAGSVREAIDAIRPARVYHCAGAAHVGKAWNAATVTLTVNVRGTHHLLEALRTSSPEARVLLPSSALIYAPSNRPISEEHALQPTSPYGISKLAQELLGYEAGLHVHIARPFNHFGPRQDPSFSTAAFARQIAEIEAGRAAPEIRVGNLEPLRDLTDVRDTVRAYQLILEQAPPGRPFNICTGQVHTVSDMLNRMLARARTAINVVADPSLYRPNDLPVLHGDPARIRAELGWTPTIPLDRTIDDLLQYWRGRTRAA